MDAKALTSSIISAGSKQAISSAASAVTSSVVNTALSAAVESKNELANVTGKGVKNAHVISNGGSRPVEYRLANNNSILRVISEYYKCFPKCDFPPYLDIFKYELDRNQSKLSSCIFGQRVVNKIATGTLSRRSKIRNAADACVHWFFAHLQERDARLLDETKVLNDPTTVVKLIVPYVTDYLASLSEDAEYNKEFIEDGYTSLVNFIVSTSYIINDFHKTFWFNQKYIKDYLNKVLRLQTLFTTSKNQIDTSFDIRPRLVDVMDAMGSLSFALKLINVKLIEPTCDITFLYPPTIIGEKIGGMHIDNPYSRQYHDQVFSTLDAVSDDPALNSIRLVEELCQQYSLYARNYIGLKKIAKKLSCKDKFDHLIQRQKILDGMVDNLQQLRDQNKQYAQSPDSMMSHDVAELIKFMLKKKILHKKEHNDGNPLWNKVNDYYKELNFVVWQARSLYCECLLIYNTLRSLKYFADNNYDEAGKSDSVRILFETSIVNFYDKLRAFSRSLSHLVSHEVNQHVPREKQISILNRFTQKPWIPQILPFLYQAIAAIIKETSNVRPGEVGSSPAYDVFYFAINMLFDEVKVSGITPGYIERVKKETDDKVLGLYCAHKIKTEIKQPLLLRSRPEALGDDLIGSKSDDDLSDCDASMGSASHSSSSVESIRASRQSKRRHRRQTSTGGSTIGDLHEREEKEELPSPHHRRGHTDVSAHDISRPGFFPIIDASTSASKQIVSPRHLRSIMSDLVGDCQNNTQCLSKRVEYFKLQSDIQSSVSVAVGNYLRHLHANRSSLYAVTGRHTNTHRDEAIDLLVSINTRFAVLPKKFTLSSFKRVYRQLQPYIDRMANDATNQPLGFYLRQELDKIPHYQSYRSARQRRLHHVVAMQPAVIQHNGEGELEQKQGDLPLALADVDRTANDDSMRLTNNR